MISEFKDIIQKEISAILNIPINEHLTHAVNIIANQCHFSHKGKVICSGMGKAGQIALGISTTFSSTGTPAVFLHPSEAQHGDIGIVQENDVMFLISNSGKTQEVIDLIVLTRNLVPKIPIIVMTRNLNSPLALNADVVLLTGDTYEICPFGLTPTISTTVMTVIGDILVFGVMKTISFTKEEYSKRHHGGYIGQQSKL